MTGRVLTISAALRILAVVVFVLVVAVTGQQLLQRRSAMVNGTLRQMARLDMVFAEQTGRAVETVDLILRSAMEMDGTWQREFAPGSQAADTHAPNAAAIDEVLRRRIEGVRQIADIAVADASGRIVLWARNGPPAAPAASELSPAGRTLLEFFRQHADAGLQISEPIRGADGHWTALLARRIDAPDGTFDGMAEASLNLSYFEDFYKAVELTENGAILLHRRDGTVLARYPHNDAVVGQSYADLPPFRDILARDIAGTLVMDSPLDGGRRVLAIRALRMFPLAVNVSVSEDRVLAQWWRETFIFMVAAVATATLIGALLLLVARETAKGEALLAEFRSARDAAEAATARLRVEMEERERAEAALRQAQRIEAVGQLTGGVAHDFNNLLTVMLGNIDLLQHTMALDATGRDRLGRMRAAAERGATLTDQLLAFARRQPLSPRVVDVNALVRGMADLLQSAIGNGIVMDMRLDDATWPAMVDPTQIELVILNLAINARDAMGKTGTLTLETGNARRGPPQLPEDPPAGDCVVVRVGDTGTGMTAEVKAKAFEPYFTTKGPGRGSGLGLSHVYGLAQQSGGGVQIETAPGQGTSVRVFLPRADPAAERPPAEPLQKAAPTSTSTILLVDDDEAVRSTTGLILETMGYKVLEAEDGQTALERLGDGMSVDILLTDVAMPGMNGPELARQVRRLRPGLPIVFFSGYADPEAVAGDAIRQRIIRKPFRASELAAQIEAALSEFQATGGAPPSPGKSLAQPGT